MLDGNFFALTSLILGVIAVGTLTFYLIPKQFAEVLRPRDWLTSLRWQLLILLSIIVLLALPSLVYQGFRYFGLEYEALRNIASVTNRLSFLALVIALISIFNYKRRD